MDDIQDMVTGYIAQVTIPKKNKDSPGGSFGKHLTVGGYNTVAGFLSKLFGKTESPVDFSSLVCDVHSHLIPGIDDGAKDMETAVEMVQKLHDLGYQKLITTPHIMSDGFPNTPEKILGGLEKLKKAVAEAGITVELEAAAEYYLDEAFEAMIGKEPLLTFGGAKKYLLFETSYVSRPMSLESAIFKLNSHGYTPVLAHPERYAFFWEAANIDGIKDLIEMGARMQVNLSSLAGNYSKRAAKIAAQLIDEDLVDFLGSDLHRPRQAEGIVQAWGAGSRLSKLVHSDRLLNVTL